MTNLLRRSGSRQFADL